MGIIEKTISTVLGTMNKKEKSRLLLWSVDRFMVGFTPNDRKELMLEIVPSLTEGVEISDVLPKMLIQMIGQDTKGGIAGLLERMDEKGVQMEGSLMVMMMMEMIPEDIKIMLPHVSKEKRTEFALKIIQILKDQGETDMTPEEKDAFESTLLAELKADR